MNTLNKVYAVLLINRSQLASLLGVSISCVIEWEKNLRNEKLHRLSKLDQVLDYFVAHYPEINKTDYKNLLDNARVMIDPNDNEYGSTSLINLICSESYNPYLFTCVDSALVQVYGLKIN
jgi:DNA-binding XRE family transcriptional regulator